MTQDNSGEKMKKYQDFSKIDLDDFKSEDHPEDCNCSYITDDRGEEILVTAAECLHPEQTRPDCFNGVHGKSRCEACLEAYDRLDLHQEQSKDHLLCDNCKRYYLKEDAPTEPHPSISDVELVALLCPRCGTEHSTLEKVGEVQ